MKTNTLRWNLILFTMLVLVSATAPAHAGNFGLGVHSGYGVIKYEEFTTDVGAKIESDATLNTFLLGVSGEYTFARPGNFFAAIVTDWAYGFEDNEKWKEDNVMMQENEISIFGQFYDLRLGYKNRRDNFYYRTYLSGGWDGIRFWRKNFVVNSVDQDIDTITEDFSLWRVGAGFGLGYQIGKWALDGRFAYSYYFDGEVRNSGHGGMVFDTNGTCLDVGLGIAREITKNITLYAGGSYTQIDLDESEVNRDITQHGNIITREDIVFPDSRTQILMGVINLTYAF